MRIGIDIDGCVYPWTQAVNRVLVNKYGIEDPGEHQHWDYLKERLTNEQWQWIWSSDAADHVFGQMEMIFDGAAAAVNELARHHEVHFVTHRNPYRTAGVTGRYLAYHFRNYRGVHVLDNSTRKFTVLEPWDIFIDDKPEIVTEFLLNTKAQVLMPYRGWNLDYEPPEGFNTQDGFVRFHDWEEVPWLVQ